MNVHDAVPPAEHDALRYYYHDATGMLLDVNEGVFKYNPTTYRMVLVEPLRQRERRVLAHLLAHENQLVTSKELLLHAWLGRFVNRQSVAVAIYNLRKMLQPMDPHGLGLTTVRGAGFVFSLTGAGLTPAPSLGFLLTSLRWGEGTLLPLAPATVFGDDES